MQVAASERHVLFLSQEMSPEAIARRIVSKYSGVQALDLKRGQLSKRQRGQVDRAIAELGKLTPYLYVSGELPTIEAMAQVVRRTARRCGGLALVVVDHLQLCRASGKHGTRNDELAAVCRELASWRHGGPCVLAVSQLNRESVRGGKADRPGLADLRDSGAIEQDADGVWMLYQDRMYSGPDPRQLKLIVAKDRDGPAGELDLTFWPAKYAFTAGAGT